MSPEPSPENPQGEKPEGKSPAPLEKAAEPPLATPIEAKREPPVIAPAPPAVAAPAQPAAFPIVSEPVSPAPANPPTPVPAILGPRIDNAVRQLRRASRRSFAVAGAAAAAGFAGWYWLRTRSPDAGVPWPLRRALDFNAKLAQAYFNDARLSPTFPSDRAGEPRVNGQYGLDGQLDAAKWKLRVEVPARKDVQQFSMHDIRSLPRVEMTTELKCIEGWAQVVQWAGARFKDFVAAHGLGQRDAKSMFDYVSIDSVGDGYYVGLDIASAMHPQTLLCYEMNGTPLTSGHGAPLRLVIPVKYGIKSIKRIGTIRFQDSRPADYWAERGYDWYAGL